MNLEREREREKEKREGRERKKKRKKRKKEREGLSKERRKLFSDELQSRKKSKMKTLDSSAVGSGSFSEASQKESGKKFDHISKKSQMVD